MHAKDKCRKPDSKSKKKLSSFITQINDSGLRYLQTNNTDENFILRGYAAPMWHGSAQR
jgi:hypothetical protein